MASLDWRMGASGKAAVWVFEKGAEPLGELHAPLGKPDKNGVRLAKVYATKVTCVGTTPDGRFIVVYSEDLQCVAARSAAVTMVNRFGGCVAALGPCCPLDSVHLAEWGLFNMEDELFIPAAPTPEAPLVVFEDAPENPLALALPSSSARPTAQVFLPAKRQGSTLALGLARDRKAGKAASTPESSIAPVDGPPITWVYGNPPESLAVYRKTNMPLERRTQLVCKRLGTDKPAFADFVTPFVQVSLFNQCTKVGKAMWASVWTAYQLIDKDFTGETLDEETHERLRRIAFGVLPAACPCGNALPKSRACGEFCSKACAADFCDLCYQKLEVTEKITVVDHRPAKRARLSAELDLLERANELCKFSSYQVHGKCEMALGMPSVAIRNGTKPCADCQREFNRKEDRMKLRALVGNIIPDDGGTAQLASKKRELQQVDAEEPKTKKELVRRCVNPECVPPTREQPLLRRTRLPPCTSLPPFA
jgi:hypothetical protein